jgi:hypothetical protein
MIWKNTKLHNIHELLETPGTDKDGEGDGDEDGEGVGEGYALTRIPNELRITLNDGARRAALSAAGCEIRFNLQGPRARLVLRSDAKSTVPLEVYQGNFQVSSHTVDAAPTEIEVTTPTNIEALDRATRERGLPFDANLTRMILPYRPPLRLIDFEGDTNPPRPWQEPPTTQLSYGSSITHGATAARPTGTYAMRTAQLLGTDLYNLGFGGGAHLEPQLADHIAERQWDIATLEMGINMVRKEEFTVEVFEERVRYFVGELARTKGDRWVFCTDLFTFSEDITGKLIGGVKKQEKFREIVKTTVGDLDKPRLIYINGKNLLRNISGLTNDLVHPAPSGMEEIAQNLSDEIKKAMETG